jgi:acyl carrier protein
LEEVKATLKRLLVEYFSLENLTPEQITDDMNIFGAGGVGLDSLDGVEVVVILHRHFGIDVKAIQKEREVLRSVGTLAPYVLANATK